MQCPVLFPATVSSRSAVTPKFSKAPLKTREKGLRAECRQLGLP